MYFGIVSQRLNVFLKTFHFINLNEFIVSHCSMEVAIMQPAHYQLLNSEPLIYLKIDFFVHIIATHYKLAVRGGACDIKSHSLLASR